jgi:hypothetical protein
MNHTSRDVQNSFVHLHLVHIKNNIDSLTFQDDKAGQKHPPDKLLWDLMDHTIDNHSVFGSANRIWYFRSPESKLSILSTC